MADRRQTRRLHAVGEDLHDLQAAQHRDGAAVLVRDEHGSVRGLRGVVGYDAGDDLRQRQPARQLDADQCVGAFDRDEDGTAGVGQLEMPDESGQWDPVTISPVSAFSRTSSLGSRLATATMRVAASTTTPSGALPTGTMRPGMGAV